VPQRALTNASTDTLAGLRGKLKMNAFGCRILQVHAVRIKMGTRLRTVGITITL